jgi:rhamnosyltransferase
MAELVTVAIPVLNGGPLFREVLTAIQAQRLGRRLEVVVADSGSSDGSRELAYRHGAAVIDIAPGEFSHGATRNVLAERARGSHIAFITQDAVPADERWLGRLLEGFEAADDVGLVFGPYRARAGASLMVRRELEDWFGSLSTQVERGPCPVADLRRSFFTDVNGCVARAAWERVPFRPVAYAEDQLLARDMLAAGYGKVFCPDAVVIHSHEYGPLEQFRRSFDEWRGLREVHAIPAPPAPRSAALGIQRAVRDDVALARRHGCRGFGVLRTGTISCRYHLTRAVGAALGSRADLLPPALRRACSLEGRAGFNPLRAGS